MVNGRCECVENPFLVRITLRRHVVDVDPVRMEDDGVALLQQLPVAGQLTSFARTTGVTERMLPQSEIVIGAAEVRVPQQDRFDFTALRAHFLHFLKSEGKFENSSIIY